MILSHEELALTRARLDSENLVPYVDPLIRRDIYQLARRMALSRMLRSVQYHEVQAEVGLFTVVIKVKENEDGTFEVILRLVFDERVPNQYWRRSPWVGLAGPGAFAGLDVQAAGDDSCPLRMWGVGGDLPDFYYCLLLPLVFAA